MYILIGIIVIGIVAVFMIKAENRKYRITEYTYKTNRVNREITLAVLSDLHNYVYGKDNSRLLKSIEDIEPDYVISAGDMIESGNCGKSPSTTLGFLRRLCERFRFIYGCGNHEWKLMNNGSELGREFLSLIDKEAKLLEKEYPDRAEHIRPLDNRVVKLLEDNINIYGLNLDKSYYKKIILNKTTPEHIEKLVGKPEKDKLNILIGHNPDQFEAYVNWSADMVLSGHIHGGIINTPWHRGMISPRFVLFPKYDWGVYEKDGTTMFLSRGLGNHTVHVRIFNRAEIMVVKLIPAER